MAIIDVEEWVRKRASEYADILKQGAMELFS